MTSRGQGSRGQGGPGQGGDTARVRAAELRAAQAARQRNVRLATAAIGLVVVVLGGLVLVKLVGGGTGSGDDTTTAAGATSTSVSAAVLRDITSVSTATADKVGTDDVTSVPTKIKAPALTSSGKPKVLYVGAEYCPYCAAQRWSMVVALSRFGGWSGLQATESGEKDVFPKTASLSFHGAKLTSDVVTFAGYEMQTNQLVGGHYTPLDELTAADQKVFDTYDKPPYVASSPGAIPFVDIGGQFVLAGASFSPELLAGKTRAQIAAAVNDPSSDIGKAVVGNANVLTAAICAQTGNQPSDVCDSRGVTAGAAALAKGQPE